MHVGFTELESNGSPGGLLLRPDLAAHIRRKGKKAQKLAEKLPSRIAERLLHARRAHHKDASLLHTIELVALITQVEAEGGSGRSSAE
jgi:hypothetical protein